MVTAPTQRNWVFQWVEVVVVRLLLFLSAWLAHRSREKWETIVQLRKKGGTQGLDGNEIASLMPIKQKSSESLCQQGFQGDTQRPESYLLPLPDWAREIQPFLANQLSAHTRRAYESDLKQFFSFLDGRLPTTDLRALRPEHIIVYRKYLEEGRLTGKPLQKSTINRKLAVVKSFLQWLTANQVLEKNPANLVKGYPQSQESSLQGLSDEEARRLLALPNRNRAAGALHSAVLHTLLFLGLRKGELINLRVGDLTEERGIAVMKVRGKGHRTRVLPLTAPVKNAIDWYLFACRRDKSQTEAPLFMPTKNPYGTALKPLNPNALTYMVVKYAKRAGILKKISPHSCRATCISNALDRKATQRSVQHLAGWSTPLMIQRYDKRREDLQNSAAFLVDYGAVSETGVT